MNLICVIQMHKSIFLLSKNDTNSIKIAYRLTQKFSDTLQPMEGAILQIVF